MGRLQQSYYSVRVILLEWLAAIHFVTLQDWSKYPMSQLGCTKKNIQLIIKHLALTTNTVFNCESEVEELNLKT